MSEQSKAYARRALLRQLESLQLTESAKAAEWLEGLKSDPGYPALAQDPEWCRVVAEWQAAIQQDEQNRAVFKGRWWNDLSDAEKARCQELGAALEGRLSRLRQAIIELWRDYRIPADVAALCEDFVQHVDNYLLWDKLLPPPHQTYTEQRGLLIGDCGATPEVYEARRTQEAEWLVNNAPGLAAVLERCGLDRTPTDILSIGTSADDPDNGPSAIRAIWAAVKVVLQRTAIRHRNADSTPPAAKPEQDEGSHQPQERPDDCRAVTVRILRAVATVLQDRADRWLKADKSNDVNEPQFRTSRFLAAFSGINEDLKQYNFYGALDWLEKIHPDLFAEVHTQMELLSKDRMGHRFVWDPLLDAAELDPNARRLSQMSKLLRRVANDVQSQAGVIAREKLPDDSAVASEFERVLQILHNMGIYIERNPKSFVELDEERIRDHFLLQLNGQFAGNATGETANGNGKTDILVRIGNRNVFIGECKFWDGPKKFNEAIDQLLGYLTWRDRQCSLLIFNRNKDSTGVAQKMHDAMMARQEYREMVGNDSQGPSRYHFAKRDDPDRLILVTTLLFDIPII